MGLIKVWSGGGGEQESPSLPSLLISFPLTDAMGIVIEADDSLYSAAFQVIGMQEQTSMQFCLHLFLLEVFALHEMLLFGIVIFS